MPKNDFPPLPTSKSDDKVVSINSLRDQFMDKASSMTGSDLIKARQANLSDFTYEEATHMEVTQKDGLITMTIKDEKEFERREQEHKKNTERTPEQKRSIMESL